MASTGSQMYTQYTDDLAVAVDQICSPVYVQMFEKVAKEQPNVLVQGEQDVLINCPNVIAWYRGDQRQAIVERIRLFHLKWFNNWLDENNTGKPPYVKWNETMKRLLLQFINLVFRIDFGDLITDEAMYNAFRQIINTIKRILLIINESNPVTIDQNAIPFVQILLQILFYFTLDNNLIINLKSLDLVGLMNEFIRKSNNDDEIHLHAYRILAVIMAEEDIKQLQNSDRIATVFITIIKQVIDSGARGEDRLHNSLRSLKVLTQHEQIREELIKQGGHSLFLRCALENKFNLLKAKLPALEILLALAFDKDFAKTLKDNETFMNHVRTLTSSPQQDLQRVATALIWKLEKELEITAEKAEDRPFPTSPSIARKKQYDIMISYSHSDKDICHRILDILEKDQLRVWIDSRLMHGATFDAMAKAIENSEFVLICMSDTYKQSPFCEMEASYAVKRRCRIIPLKVTPNYQPDGWLGVLTSALIYVDFPKLGFAKASEELKKQIGLFRTKNTLSTTVNQDQVNHDLSSSTNVKPELIPSVTSNKELRPVVEYPHCIDMWTKDHVESFLLDKQLGVLLSAFEGMNGRLLHKVYTMCQSNEQAMFLSLKEDVARSQHTTILSLKDYVTFLEEIKIYIPYTTTSQLNPASIVCNIM